MTSIKETACPGSPLSPSNAHEQRPEESRRSILRVHGRPPHQQVRGEDRRDRGRELGGRNHRRDRIRKEHPALTDLASPWLHSFRRNRCHPASSCRSSLRFQVNPAVRSMYLSGN